MGKDKDSKSIVLSPQYKKWTTEAVNLELQTELEFQESKEQLYIKMGNELLTNNVPSKEIYSIIHRDLQNAIRLKKNDDKYILNNSWLYEVCQENGWTKSSATKIDDSSTITKELGDDEPFAILRNQMLFIFEKMIRSLHENKKLIRDKEIPKEIWQKFFSDQSETKKYFDVIQGMLVAHLEDADRCRDARQLILPTERFLVMAITHFIYDSWYCKRYHAIVKQRSIITPKKLSIYKNDTQSLSNLIYHTMEDPMNLHFLDIRCPKCNKYLLKTVWNVDGTWHITCINEIEHNDKKPIFPASMISEKLQQLMNKHSPAAKQFLEERQIIIPDNEPTVS